MTIPVLPLTGFYISQLIRFARVSSHVVDFKAYRNRNLMVTLYINSKKIVGRADFSDQFRKIIVCYKRIGYNINIMRQSACLVFNPITVNNFASLFNCTPVGRASDSVMAPT